MNYIRDDLKDPYYRHWSPYRKLNKLKYVLSFPRMLCSAYVVKKEISVFPNFIQRYIKLSSNKYYTSNDFAQNPICADIYCVGSDQVWNSTNNCGAGFVDAYYLSFVPVDSKKISFASSFGRESVNKKELNKMKSYLSSFASLSVREISGIKILEQMGIDNGVCILDPTLLIKAQQWFNLTDEKLINDEPYLLVYGFSNNALINKAAKIIAKEKNLKIRRIGIGFSQKKYRHTEIFPSINKWLTLFKNASYVVTDSFHGTVFSINFNRNFSVVYPLKYSSRLQSILNITNLENRVLHSIEDINNKVYNKTIDYNLVNSILEKERIKAKDYISAAIK